MTNEEKIEWRKKAIPLLKEFLAKTVGYPNCSNEAIMKNLDLMWAELGSNNLIVEGMTFQMFIVCAQKKYMEREMARIIGL